MLIVYPGAIGPRRLLVDVLREQHADRVLSYKTERDFREKNGVPLADDVDFAAEERRAAALGEAAQQGNLHLLRLGYQAGLLATANAPQDPGEWVAPDGLEGLHLEPVFPSAADTRRMRRALGDAYEAGDIEALHCAEDAIVRAGCKALWGLTVVDDAGEHHGQVVRDFSDSDLEAFRAAGLLTWVLSAVLFLWGLPRGKAWRSGVPLPPT
jgi:hypothetical protein